MNLNRSYHNQAQGSQEHGLNRNRNCDDVYGKRQLQERIIPLTQGGEANTNRNYQTKRGGSLVVQSSLSHSASLPALKKKSVSFLHSDSHGRMNLNQSYHNQSYHNQSYHNQARPGSQEHGLNCNRNCDDVYGNRQLQERIIPLTQGGEANTNRNYQTKRGGSLVVQSSLSHSASLPALKKKSVSIPNSSSYTNMDKLSQQRHQKNMRLVTINGPIQGRNTEEPTRPLEEMVVNNGIDRGKGEGKNSYDCNSKIGSLAASSSTDVLRSFLTQSDNHSGPPPPTSRGRERQIFDEKNQNERAKSRSSSRHNGRQRRTSLLKGPPPATSRGRQRQIFDGKNQNERAQSRSSSRHNGRQRRTSVLKRSASVVSASSTANRFHENDLLRKTPILPQESKSLEAHRQEVRTARNSIVFESCPDLRSRRQRSKFKSRSTSKSRNKNFAHLSVSGGANSIEYAQGKEQTTNSNDNATWSIPAIDTSLSNSRVHKADQVSISASAHYDDDSDASGNSEDAVLRKLDRLALGPSSRKLNAPSLALVSQTKEGTEKKSFLKSPSIPIARLQRRLKWAKAPCYEPSTFFEFDEWFEHCRDPGVLSERSRLRGGQRDPSDPSKRSEEYSPREDVLFMEHLTAEARWIREAEDPMPATCKKSQLILDAVDLQRSFEFSKKGEENVFSLRFPQHIFDIVKLLPGNSRCCDCGSLYRQVDKKQLIWAYVAHGTTICDECAFQHLHQGRQVEIKSFETDQVWKFNDIMSMLEGGNYAFLLEVCDGASAITNVSACSQSSYNSIFSSTAASRYSKLLKEKVLNSKVKLVQAN